MVKIIMNNKTRVFYSRHKHLLVIKPRPRLHCVGVPHIGTLPNSLLDVFTLQLFVHTFHVQIENRARVFCLEFLWARTIHLPNAGFVRVEPFTLVKRSGSMAGCQSRTKQEVVADSVSLATPCAGLNVNASYNIGTWDHVHAETKQVMLIKKKANKVESINIPLGGHAFLNAFTWSHRPIEPEIDI